MNRYKIIPLAALSILASSCSTKIDAQSNNTAVNGRAETHVTTSPPQVGDVLSGNKAKFNNAETGGAAISQPKKPSEQNAAEQSATAE